MTRSSLSSSAPIGTYDLEVGASTASLAQFAGAPSKADKAQARENAAALRRALEDSEQPRRAAPLETVEELEETADAVTDRVEHANRLFSAAAENRLDRDLLTGEIGTLLGLLDRLDKQGRYDEEIRVAKALHGLCVLAFRWLDLVRALRSAFGAASAAGDQAGQAWALNELGALHLCIGQARKAEEYLARAVELQDRLGDAAGRCATRHNLDSARRDLARPIQIRRPRRIAVVAAVTAAFAFFGAGGAALGYVIGDRGGDSSATTGVSTTTTSGSTTGSTTSGSTTSGSTGTTTSSTVELSVATDGDGSVAGPGIDCGSDCSEQVADGTTVTLTETAGRGSDFDGWQGVACDEGSQSGASCTFTVDGGAQVLASFSPHVD
jgi:tetratricopeptide (TPR) repeat protein